MVYRFDELRSDLRRAFAGSFRRLEHHIIYYPRSAVCYVFFAPATTGRRGHRPKDKTTYSYNSLRETGPFPAVLVLLYLPYGGWCFGCERVSEKYLQFHLSVPGARYLFIVDSTLCRPRTLYF